MKKIILILCLFSILPCYAAKMDCSKYPYNQEKIYGEQWDYAQNYLQCTFDEHIIPLNKKYLYKEQDQYWDKIDEILEHKYDNAEKYGKGIPSNLIGKYNTMDKIDKLVYKESTLYNLGKIITGQAEYQGPKYMYGNGTWKGYINVQIDENKVFNDLNDLEKLNLTTRLIRQMFYFSGNKNLISSAYDFNVYVCNLVGIALNYKSISFAQTVKDFYFKNKINNELQEIMQNQ